MIEEKTNIEHAMLKDWWKNVILKERRRGACCI
jgi:hypothetical protein